jgi:hypothetical protein
MDKATHISDSDLILFTDQEMHADSAANAERHLNICADCRKRLNDLRSGAAAYEEYHQQVLKPAFDLPAIDWAAIRHRPGEKRRKRSFWFQPATLWAATALASGLILSILYVQRSSRPEMTELLTKAAAAPESTRGPLLLTVGGHHWLRPAVYRRGEAAVAVPARERSTVQHVHALFVEAHYSWEDPLSARSFAVWRYQLPQKQDEVTLIRGVDGKRRFYRVQTRTAAGILRTASLTLQADTYRSTAAAFEFQGEDPVELSEQPVEGAGTARQEVQENPAEHPKVTETRAGPEDELRVFAALNAIGADVEEPIDVKLDAKRQHVVVTGMGMPPARQKEVENALADLPNTIVRFNSAQADRNAAPNNEKPDTYTADSRSAFRQSLEARAGGPGQLQTITDRALDTSNALFAQAHSLLVLAQEFPPNVELGLRGSDRQALLGLRQRHIGAIEYAVRQLRDELNPLLEGEPAQGSPPHNSKNSSWQDSAEELFEAARNLNELVSRLLAGSNVEQAGGEMLNQLPSDLSKLEGRIRAQSAAER